MAYLGRTAYCRYYDEADRVIRNRSKGNDYNKKCSVAHATSLIRRSSCSIALHYQKKDLLTYFEDGFFSWQAGKNTQSVLDRLNYFCPEDYYFVLEKKKIVAKISDLGDNMPSIEEGRLLKYKSY